MKENELTFKQAYERLREIYEYLSKAEIVDIDELVKLQNEAEKLYKFCLDQIKKIENSVKRLDW